MKYVLKLTDMAYERADAISECSSLGELFIKHFEKIYKEPKSQAVNHWCEEMQGWLDKVRKIVLKYNKKLLSFTQLVDWFFTVGSSPEYLFKDDNMVDKYEEFLQNISKFNFNVLTTVKTIF